MTVSEVLHSLGDNEQLVDISGVGRVSPFYRGTVSELDFDGKGWIEAPVRAMYAMGEYKTCTLDDHLQNPSIRELIVSVRLYILVEA